MINIVASTSKASPDGSTMVSDAINTSGATGLFVGVAYFDGSSINVSDSYENTWFSLTAKSESPQVCQLFYGVGTHGSFPVVGPGHTFTVTCISSFPSLFVLAASEVAVFLPFDQENGNTAASGTTISTGSVTPSENNEIVVALVGTNGTITYGINGGFTIAESLSNVGANFAGALAYLIQTTAICSIYCNF